MSWRSSVSSRSESVRGLIPGHACSSSVKRRGPSDRSWTMSAVHFGAITSPVAATAHSVLCTSFLVRSATVRVYRPAPTPALGSRPHCQNERVARLYATTGREFARLDGSDGGWNVEISLHESGAQCLAVDPADPDVVYVGL